MSANKPICIIPARGGSKRLPKKNIVRVGGKPVIGWTIEQAHSAGIFERIIVSTDDKAISDVAADYPFVEIWNRAEELASDFATVDHVCLDILSQLKNKTGVLPEFFCCLYATAILRSVDDILLGYNKMQEGNCETAMTVTEYEQYPHQALRFDDGKVSVQWPDLLSTPRQQRPHFVVDAGSVYWLKTKAFIQNENFYSNDIEGYIVPRSRAIDLDTEEDLKLLKHYFSMLKNPLI